MTPEVMYIVTALASTVATLGGILWRMASARVATLESEALALEKENKRYLVLILAAAEKEGGMNELRGELARMIKESP